MIYIFIAGSYTPWLTLKTWEPRDGWGRFFRWAIWPFALLGIIYQQLFHERFKLLETTFYILIGVLPSLVVYEMVSKDENTNFKVKSLLKTCLYLLVKCKLPLHCACRWIMTDLLASTEFRIRKIEKLSYEIMTLFSRWTTLVLTSLNLAVWST